MNVGLWVQLEAKPDKAEEVASFLKQAIYLANQEVDTLVWFSVQLNPTTFGIFDTHSNEAGRQAHLSGAIAVQLMGKSDEWFVKPPQIEFHNVLSAKLPQ